MGYPLIVQLQAPRIYCFLADKLSDQLVYQSDSFGPIDRQCLEDSVFRRVAPRNLLEASEIGAAPRY